MLAVVAGLTLSGVATVCHDLWVNVVRHGHSSESEQLTVARIATVAIAALAVFLGIVFEGQNVAFMAGLACAVAASANFPALLLSITWKRFMTPAAVASIGVGTFSALLMIGLSPTVQVDMLGKNLADASRAWWFVPMKNPAIISIPLSFIVAVAVSLLTREDGVASTFREMRHRIMFGKAREAYPER